MNAPLFASGRLVPLMRAHCGHCGIDSLRGGICTNPLCAWFEVSR